MKKRRKLCCTFVYLLEGWVESWEWCYVMLEWPALRLLTVVNQKVSFRLRSVIVLLFLLLLCCVVVFFLHCRVSTQRRLANVAQRLLVYMFPRGPTYYPERGRRVRWFNRPAWPCAVTSPSVLWARGRDSERASALRGCSVWKRSSPTVIDVIAKKRKKHYLKGKERWPCPPPPNTV